MATQAAATLGLVGAGVLFFVGAGVLLAVGAGVFLAVGAGVFFTVGAGVFLSAVVGALTGEPRDGAVGVAATCRGTHRRSGDRPWVQYVSSDVQQRIQTSHHRHVLQQPWHAAAAWLTIMGTGGAPSGA